MRNSKILEPLRGVGGHTSLIKENMARETIDPKTNVTPD